MIGHNCDHGVFCILSHKGSAWAAAPVTPLSYDSGYRTMEETFVERLD